MWSNKFRPKSFAELTAHPEANEILQQLSKTQNLPHLLFVGPNGSGRHTRALCLLRQLFNITTISCVPSTVTFRHNEKSEEISVLSSNLHTELNPSQFGVQDQYIITSVIKEAAQTAAVNQKFKVIFIQQADQLSFLAQQALRRLMEEHARSCKLFLFAEQASGLIPAVKSRCFSIYLPRFSDQDIFKQQLPNTIKFSESEQEQLLKFASGNMRRYLLLAQALVVQRETGPKEVEDVLPKWEQLTRELVKRYFIQREAVDQQLRAKIIEILKQGISGDVLLYELFMQILKLNIIKGNPKFLDLVATVASEYDARLRQAQIQLIHLEAFFLTILGRMRDLVKNQ